MKFTRQSLCEDLKRLEVGLSNSGSVG